jgi:hypothetical protein
MTAMDSFSYLAFCEKCGDITAHKWAKDGSTYCTEHPSEKAILQDEAERKYE